MYNYYYESFGVVCEYSDRAGRGPDGVSKLVFCRRLGDEEIDVNIESVAFSGGVVDVHKVGDLWRELVVTRKEAFISLK